jgi:hypothetical protein
VLDDLDDPQALAIVLEAPEVAHHAIEHPLARVAEGRVAQVVGESHGLDEILVEAERPRQAAADLRGLERMGQAVAVVIALVVDEDLRLVLEAPERRGVDDAVAVALEGGAVRLGSGWRRPRLSRLRRRRAPARSSRSSRCARVLTVGIRSSPSGSRSP